MNSTTFSGKRLLSMLLIVAMLMGLMPGSVFATGEGQTTTVVESTEAPQMGVPTEEEVPPVVVNPTAEGDVASLNVNDTETFYANIDDALAAANEAVAAGGTPETVTLKVLKDAVFAEDSLGYMANGVVATIVLNGLTLDLNGCTLSVNTDNYYGFSTDEGYTTILRDSSEGKTGKLECDYRAYQIAGTVNVYGGQVVGTEGNAAYALLANTAVLNHYDGIVSHARGIEGVYGGHTSIYGGTFTSYRDFHSVSKDELTIYGGTFQDGILIYNNNDYVAPEDYLAPGHIFVDESGNVVTGDALGSTTVTVINCAATVTTTGGDTTICDSFEAAIAYAKTQSGSTVKLMQDVEMEMYIGNLPDGNSVILDLNGKTITGTTMYALVFNNGTWTIRDSSEAQTGAIRGETYAFSNHGNLTIEGGTFNKIGNYGDLTIRGGTFADSIGLLKDGNLQVYGGSFNGSAEDILIVRVNFDYTGAIDIFDGRFAGGLQLLVYGTDNTSTENSVNDLLAEGTFFQNESGKKVTVADDATTTGTETVIVATATTMVAELTVGEDVYYFADIDKALAAANEAVATSNYTYEQIVLKVLKDTEFGNESKVNGRVSLNGFTLDLNGHILGIIAESQEYTLFVTRREYTTQIMDTSAEGTGQLKISGWYQVDPNATLNIYGGGIWSDIRSMSTAGTVNIYNGTMTESLEVLKGKLNIYGGTFTGDKDFTCREADICLYGGTFVNGVREVFGKDVTGFLAVGHVFVDKNGNVITGDALRSTTVTVINCVATVTTTGGVTTAYSNFEDAMAYAKNNAGSTVKLLQDATGESTDIETLVTLDLNGKELDLGENGICVYGNIGKTGTAHLTIQDSDPAATGKITSASTEATICFGSGNSLLTVNSGILENTGENGAILRLMYEGDAVIHGGTFLGDLDIYVVSAATKYRGTVDIDGGTFVNGLQMKAATGSDTDMPEQTLQELLAEGAIILTEDGRKVTLTDGAMTTGTETVVVASAATLEGELTVGEDVCYFTSIDEAHKAADEAVAAGGTPETVTLKVLKDATVADSYLNGFTLDLNGCVLTAAGTHNYVVSCNYTTVIMDSSSAKTGHLNSNNIWACALHNGGTLTIRGGQIGSSRNTNAIDNEGTLYVEGGIFPGEIQNTMSVPETYIYAGTFSGLSLKVGSTTIYGGVFKSRKVQLGRGASLVIAGGEYSEGIRISNLAYEHDFTPGAPEDYLADGYVFVDANGYAITGDALNTTTVTVKNPVAIVTTAGGVATSYDSLQVAADYAATQTNSTVKMMQNVDLGSKCLNIKGGTFTLDLNGKELKADYPFSGGTLKFDYQGSPNLTIRDSSATDTTPGTGTIIGNDNYAVSTGGAKNGSLTIYGGNFTSAEDGAVSVSNNIVFTVYGGTFDTGENGGDAVSLSNTTTMIYGGTFRGRYALSGASSTTALNCKIYGGTFQGREVDLHVGELWGNTDTPKNYEFYGGTFPGGLTIKHSGSSTNVTNQLAEGCAFFTEAGAVVIPAADALTTGTETVTVGKLSDCEASVTVDETTTIYIDIYKALAAANEAVAAGGTPETVTLKILKDAETTDTYLNGFTLDLNGCTLTAAERYNYAVSSEYTTVIQDSSDAKTGVLKSTNNAVCIANRGTLTILGGRFEGKSSSSYSIHNYRTLHIKGGVFPGIVQNKASISDASTPETYIYAGTFSGLIARYGSTTIYGGVFKSREVQLGREASLVIAGGEYSEGIHISKPEYEQDFIPGTPEDYLAEGYVFVDARKSLITGDALKNTAVTVMNGAAAVIMGETTTVYDTFKGALEAARKNSGATVKLMQNVEGYYTMFRTVITIDLNGYVLDMGTANFDVGATTGGSTCHLTIADTSEAQTGVFTTNSEYLVCASGTGASAGKLTILGGTLECNGGKLYKSAVNLIGDGCLEIKGGSLQGTENDICVNNSSTSFTGTIDISGGTFPGGLQFSVYSSSYGTTEKSVGDLLAEGYAFFTEAGVPIFPAADALTTGTETVTVQKKVALSIALDKEQYYKDDGTIKVTITTLQKELSGWLYTYIDGTKIDQESYSVSGGRAPLTSGKVYTKSLSNIDLGDHEIYLVFVPDDTTIAEGQSNTVAFSVGKIPNDRLTKHFTNGETRVTYDGTVKAADIKSIYNDGNSFYVPDTGFTLTYWQNDTQVTEPVNVGTYTVKFTMAENDCYEAVTDFEIGTLVIEQIAFVLDVLNYTLPTEARYTGFAHTARVTMKSGITGYGELTVEYLAEGQTERTTAAPVEPGTYTVYASVTGGGNVKAGELVLGSFTINKNGLYNSINMEINGETWVQDSFENFYSAYCAEYEDKTAVQIKLSPLPSYSMAAVPTGTVEFRVAEVVDDTRGEYTTVATAELDENGVVHLEFQLAPGKYIYTIKYSGDHHYMANEYSHQNCNIIITPTTVTLTPSGLEQIYNGTARTISFTNNTKLLGMEDFVVTYYQVNENMGTISKVNRAVSAGRYLYVVELKDEHKENYRFANPITIDGDTLPEGTYDNAGYMDIVIGLPEAQEPIYFVEGAVTVYLADGTYSGNTLVNPNNTVPTYTSSNESVAEVAADGTVTLKRTGTVTIFATSEKEGTTPVRASYTLTIEKKDATISVNGLTTTYGETFALTEDMLTITGCALSDLNLTDLTYTGYTVGQGVGTYYITPAGITSEAYDLTFVAGTLTVQPRAIDATTITITAATKVYDGTTAAELTAVLPEGAVLAGDKVTVTAEGAYTAATAGTVEAAVTALILEGKDSGNYVLTGTAPAIAVGEIQQATVTFTTESQTFTYDGTAKALDIVAKTNNGLTAEYTVQYNAEPVLPGTYTVTVSLTDTVNYVADVSGLEGKQLTITAAKQQSFTVSGLENGIRYGDKLTLTAENAEGEVTFAIIEGTAATISGNEITAIGTGKVVILATSVKEGFEDKTVKVTITVGKRLITASLETVTDRQYNGTTEVNATVILNGIINEDSVSVTNVAEIQTSDAAKNKSVTITLGELTGEDAALYELTTESLRGKVNILPREIDASAITVTANRKIYDGTIAADLTAVLPEGAILDGDKVTITAEGAYTDATAGTTTANVTALTLEGNDADNYVLVGTAPATAAGNIEKATVTFTTASKTVSYDGYQKVLEVNVQTNNGLTVDYTVTYSTADGSAPILPGTYTVSVTLTDTVNYTADVTGLEGKTLTITAAKQQSFTISGLEDGIRYGDTKQLTADGAEGTVTFTIEEGTAATVTASGELTATGTGKVVILATSVKEGFEDKTVKVTVTVGKRLITASVESVTDRPYDGTTEVTATVKLNGIINNDTVNVTNVAEIQTPDAGNNKSVSITIGELTGEDASFYELTTETLRGKVNITARAIDASAVVITAEGKIYDATTATTLSATLPEGAVLNGDQVTITAEGAYTAATAGTTTANVTALTLGGNDARNYVLTGTAPATALGEITKATATFTTASKTVSYDGYEKVLEINMKTNNGLTADYTVTYSTADGSNPILPGTYTVTVSLTDTVNYTADVTGLEGKTLTITAAKQQSFTISGLEDGIRYGDTKQITADGAEGVVTFQIIEGTAATVTASGELTATGTGKVVILATSVKEGFEDKTVKVTVTVGKRLITASLESVTDRVYNGSTVVNATVKLENTVSGDDVMVNGVIAEMMTPGVGENKTVSITISGLSGATAEFYELTNTTLRGTVNITPKTVEAIAFTVSDKTYDGTTVAELVNVTPTGILGSDQVTATAKVSFQDANAGENKTIHLVDVALTGADARNYWIADTTAVTVNTPTIHKALVNIFCAETTTYTYDGAVKSVYISALTNGKAFNGYTVSYMLDGVATEPVNVGTYTLVITLNDEANYELAPYTAKLVIEPATQDETTIEGIPDRVYYGDNFTVTVPGTSGTVSYEVIGAATMDENGKVTAKDVGTITIKATITMANYKDQVITRTITAYPRVLTATATAANRTYNGKNEVDVTISLSNVVTGDNVTATAQGQMATSDAGTDKLVYVTGITLSDNVHYTLEDATLQTTVDIARIVISSITATAQDKIYDGTDIATVTITGSSNILSGDEVTITGNGRFASANAGKHTVTVTPTAITGPKAQNYQLASGLTGTAQAEILPATVIFEVGTASFIYDGKVKAVEVTAELNGKTFTGFTVSYDPAEPVNVGTYTVTVTLNDSHNYVGAPEAFTMEILPADQEKLIIAGMPGVVDYGRVFTLTTNAHELATVTWTTSDATIATVDKNGTVTIVDVDREVTITATSSMANHNDATATVTFTPVAKQVSFQLSDLITTYDSTVQGITVTPSVEGLTDYTVTYTDEQGRVVDPVNAGLYQVEVKTTGNKYSGYTMGTFTIKKGLIAGELTMEGWTYGEEANEPNCNMSVSGLRPEFTYSGTGLKDGKPYGAGQYTVTATFADRNHETLVLTADFEIEKVALTVTAGDATRAYGEANPAFGLSYSGFVYGEGEENLLVVPSATTTATTASDVGEYTITVAGGRSENYEFTYVSGKLAIVPAQGTLTITGSSHEVTIGQTMYLQAHLNGFRPNVIWSSSDENVAVVDENGKVTIVGAGNATITAKLNERNFVADDATFLLETTQKVISLLPKTTVFTYNGMVQSVEFLETEGFTPVVGENVQVTYTLTTSPEEVELRNAGTYVATYVIDDPAYAGSGTFMVYMNKASRTLRPADLEKTYGEANPAFTIDPNGLLGDDVTDEAYIARVNAMFVFTCEANDKSLEGTYPITMALAEGHSLTEDQNYDFTIAAEPGNLIIRSITGSETCPSAHFTDLNPNAWYHEAVDYVVGHGLMNGVSDTLFAPQSSATRGMIVTILYRLEGEPESGENVFTDVAEGAWYADAIAWANANGIVLGYGDDTFRPNQAITREEMAVIMYRYAAFKGCDTDKGADLSGYSDAQTISGWAKDAMAWANAAGLIQGRTETTLAPKGTATRVELATILMRLIENVL